MTPKIIELLIEDNDDQAGLDGIALVNMPAHEAAFEYFASQEETCSHYVLSDEQIPQVIQMFHSYGEPQGLLEKEGFKIVSVKPVGKKEFAIIADPNAPSSQDTPDVKFRYKYVGPQDEKNRTFCAQMMRANRVFRIEDINAMSLASENPVGPDGYDMFEWRGSFNCRHRWVQLMYAADTEIINKASVRKGLEGEDDMPGPDTLTNAAREAGYAPRVGFSKKSSFAKESIDFDDTLSTPRGQELAKKLIADGVDLHIVTRRQQTANEAVEKIAKEVGIPLSKIHYTNGKLKWDTLQKLGITKHYDNSPDEIKAIKDNTKIQGVKFSEYKFSTENPNVSALSPYVDQVTKKVVRKPVLAAGLEDACWEGYEAIGLKDDGSPNCVPIKEEMSEDGNYVVDELFSYNDYPELIRKNAQSALDYIERTGNPNDCMTQVGKVRAQQLAQGKPISIETVKRMKAFITRHTIDLESSKSYDDGCGKLAMDAWGGVEALPWVERTIQQYEKMSSTETTFSVFNAEQRLVVGPAMIPDKMIIRRNEITGEIYYVYFSSDTIKKLQQKFMKEKLLDKTNLEHGRRFLKDVDVVESWIVDDPERDKQQVFGMDYPAGTWMITMKVTDDDTWDKVKDGQLKGFSVQGYFLEKAKFNHINQDLIEEIKSILKQVK